MNLFLSLIMMLIAFGCAAACSSDEPNDTVVSGAKADAPDASEPDAESSASTSSTVLDLADVSANPDTYEWFDFKPNVKKLILAGAAETRHVAILWYTVADGGVALHYHAKTESVYVIDGTQTDAKGTYPTGTVYFNPPGSGHQIRDSSGFFLLAYAAPPDFAGTDLIGEYTPIRIDTDAPDLTSAFPFEEEQAGIKTFAPALDAGGGLSAKFIETSSSDAYSFDGNYLVVLDGSCEIDARTCTKDTLVVAKAIDPEAFKLSASRDATCLVMGVSF